MAASYKRRTLLIQRDNERRLDQALGDLAQQIGRLVVNAALPVENGERRVPNQRGVRERLRRDLWEQVVKPFFIGRGNEALDGAQPQSPYAQIIVDGVEAVIRVEVERQVAIARKYAGRDPVVWDWLTAPGRVRPAGEMKSGSKIISEQNKPWYDPFHTFVYSNSPYRLSDRIWNTAIEVRARIDELLDYHIARGTAAVDIADLLVPYLNPSAARRTTTKPYGTVGSYAARRLARTEITAAAGRSTINAALVNPYVDGIDWALSVSHPKLDICDSIASIGMGGGRIKEPYPVDGVPSYPPHPHCLCTLIPALIRNPAAITADLRRQIEEARTGRSGGEVEALRGVFDVEWLFQALLLGWISEVIERIGA